MAALLLLVATKLLLVTITSHYAVDADCKLRRKQSSMGSRNRLIRKGVEVWKRARRARTLDFPRRPLILRQSLLLTPLCLLCICQPTESDSSFTHPD